MKLNTISKLSQALLTTGLGCLCLSPPSLAVTLDQFECTISIESPTEPTKKFFVNTGVARKPSPNPWGDFDLYRGQFKIQHSDGERHFGIDYSYEIALNEDLSFSQARATMFTCSAEYYCDGAEDFSLCASSTCLTPGDPFASPSQWSPIGIDNRGVPIFDPNKSPLAHRQFDDELWKISCKHQGAIY